MKKHMIGIACAVMATVAHAQMSKQQCKTWHKREQTVLVTATYCKWPNYGGSVQQDISRFMETKKCSLRDKEKERIAKAAHRNFQEQSKDKRELDVCMMMMRYVREVDLKLRLEKNSQSGAAPLYIER